MSSAGINVLYLVVSASSGLFFGLVALGIIPLQGVPSALSILTVLGCAMAFYRSRDTRQAQVNLLSNNSRLFTVLLSLLVLVVFVGVVALRISGPVAVDVYRNLSFFLVAAFIGMSVFFMRKMFKA